MLRTYATRRTFTSVARLAKEKSFTEQAAEAAKKVAGAFKADGAIGKECMFSSVSFCIVSTLTLCVCYSQRRRQGRRRRARGWRPILRRWIGWQAVYVFPRSLSRLVSCKVEQTC